MIANSFVQNAWYVAGMSAEFATNQLQGMVIAKKPIVIWRTGEGKVVAFDDRCVHKRMPLSCGKILANGTLECSYHGFTYDGNGKCVAIPSQMDVPIPSRAKLKPFPVIEQDGVVWVWAGDPDKMGKEVYRGGFDSKVIALSIMADAEGKFVEAVGPQVAEGIRHFQPMPDTSAAGYKKFLGLMGAPADRLYLFPPNTHDQISVVAMAMEKAKSPVAAEWSKQIITVCNGPGENVDDVVDALKLIRAGKAINFSGAGSTCDFTPNGDQLGRGMGQWIIKGGKSVFVDYAKP